MRVVFPRTYTQYTQQRLSLLAAISRARGITPANGTEDEGEDAKEDKGKKQKESEL